MLSCVMVYQCSTKCGTRNTGGTRNDFKGYVAEERLLKIVQYLALNKESKSCN